MGSVALVRDVFVETMGYQSPAGRYVPGPLARVGYLIRGECQTEFYYFSDGVAVNANYSSHFSPCSNGEDVPQRRKRRRTCRIEFYMDRVWIGGEFDCPYGVASKSPFLRRIIGYAEGPDNRLSLQDGPEFEIDGSGEMFELDEAGQRIGPAVFRGQSYGDFVLGKIRFFSGHLQAKERHRWVSGSMASLRTPRSEFERIAIEYFDKRDRRFVGTVHLSFDEDEADWLAEWSEKLNRGSGIRRGDFTGLES